jgi:hypothetical protein
MTKTALKLIILALVLSAVSCKEEVDPEYTVIELDYGYDNFISNIRDNSEDIIIKRRNIVFIEVDSVGVMRIKDQIVADSLIVPELKKYITPTPENNKMPATVEKEFRIFGKVHVTENLMIVGDFHKDLSYDRYSQIRNEIFIAHNEVRNEITRKKFNKPLHKIIFSREEYDAVIWGEIRQIIPIRYNEITRRD